MATGPNSCIERKTSIAKADYVNYGGFKRDGISRASGLRSFFGENFIQPIKDSTSLMTVHGSRLALKELAAK